MTTLAPPDSTLSGAASSSDQHVARRNTVDVATVGWFIQHEIRLAFRDWIPRGKTTQVAIISALIVIALHGIAYEFVALIPAKALVNQSESPFALLVASLAIVSLFTMMIAQAMEAVTRAFYVRGDLELILSSPASSRKLFAVRMVATTIATASLVGFLILPFIDMLAFAHGIGWLGGYCVLLALSALSQTLALLITGGLFRWIGPRRTRLMAQVIGAVLGATAVIGGQVPAILKSGTLSRLALISDPTILAVLPQPSSLIWLPAKAAMGNPLAISLLLMASFAALAATIYRMSNGFAEMVVTAAGISEQKAVSTRRTQFGRANSPAKALRQKELRLILRDPWLVSQSLMQILYLVPPALLLWRNFGDKAGTLAILVPVIVMASGQLAGGLAWLAISAEDAPDLITTAPIRDNLALRAKIEAVALAVAWVSGPFLLALGLGAPLTAFFGLIFSGLAVGSATIIQFRFRTQARRSQFRRRQRSSRLATLAETFTGIAWAGAAGLLAAGNSICLVPILIATAITGACLINRGRTG